MGSSVRLIEGVFVSAVYITSWIRHDEGRLVHLTGYFAQPSIEDPKIAENIVVARIIMDQQTAHVLLNALNNITAQQANPREAPEINSGRGGAH